MTRRYWLLKSEPHVFSFDDLLAAPGRTTMWDGVRNYQARNRMRDDMQVGDGVLYYHSSCPEPGVAGLAEVASAAYDDPTQFDAGAKGFDPKSPPENPRWQLVDVRAVQRLPVYVPLTTLREDPALAAMELLRRGNRLSVQAVSAAEWERVLALGEASGAASGGSSVSARRRHA